MRNICTAAWMDVRGEMHGNCDVDACPKNHPLRHIFSSVTHAIWEQLRQPKVFRLSAFDFFAFLAFTYGLACPSMLHKLHSNTTLHIHELQALLALSCQLCLHSVH